MWYALIRTYIPIRVALLTAAVKGVLSHAVPRPHKIWMSDFQWTVMLNEIKVPTKLLMPSRAVSIPNCCPFSHRFLSLV